MKLTIKTLKQVEYKVEVPDDKITVLDLKNEIEKVHGFDAQVIKLLYNGAVLDNAKTLADYKIGNEFVLILMNNKVKPKNVPVQPEQPQQQPQQTNEQPKAQPQPQAQQPKPKEPEKDYSAQISSLVEMGFENSQADAAIKAAKGNVELAIEFLYNGIPENLPNLDEMSQNSQSSAQNMTPVQKVASIVKVICSRDPSALQIILANIQQNDPDLFQQIKDNENEFKELISKPLDENDLAAFMQYNREMEGEGGLPGMGGTGSHGGQRQGGATIQLTKEESEAIKRLMDLGNFDKTDVLQTYFACDKNEEIAANMLFEQKMKDDSMNQLNNVLGNFGQGQGNQSGNQSGNQNGNQGNSGQNGQAPSEQQPPQAPQDPQQPQQPPEK